MFGIKQRAILQAECARLKNVVDYYRIETDQLHERINDMIAQIYELQHTIDNLGGEMQIKSAKENAYDDLLKRHKELGENFKRASALIQSMNGYSDRYEKTAHTNYIRMALDYARSVWGIGK